MFVQFNPPTLFGSFQMVVQLHVHTQFCLDTSKWWINGPSNLNDSTAYYQHCSNGITTCVRNQWAFLKVEILNGFKWSISRRVNWSNLLISPTENYLYQNCGTPVWLCVIFENMKQAAVTYLLLLDQWLRWVSCSWISFQQIHQSLFWNLVANAK